MRRRRLPAAGRAPWQLLLGGVLLLALVLRLRWGLGDDGIYWPDEIYQSLEPAHSIAFGEGRLAWEYVEGARSWAFPGLLAALLATLGFVGIDHPAAYLDVVKVGFALIGAATAFGVFLLARVAGASRGAAIAGAAAFAFAAPFVYFGHRALSETASALPVVLGFAFVLWPERRRWMLWAGASLLGFAVLLRLQNGVFCLALVGILAARRDWRATGEAAAVLAAWALILGVLDLITWGSLFHSARTYVEFNVIEDGAAQWGTSPFLYYVESLWAGMPELTVLLLGLALLAVRRAPALFAAALLFLLVHSAIGHKELRFLLPMVPLLCALAAVGIDVVGDRIDLGLGRFAAYAVGIVAAVSGLHAGSLTWGDLGAYPDRPGMTAWDEFGDVNRMILVARDRPDICGLRIQGVHWASTGAFTYFHRELPLSWDGDPDTAHEVFNYAIVPVGAEAGRQVVAQDRNQALVRLAGTCAPDPARTGA